MTIGSPINTVFNSNVYLKEDLLDTAKNLEIYMEDSITIIECILKEDGKFPFLSPMYLYRLEDITKELLYKLYEKDSYNFITAFKELGRRLRNIDDKDGLNIYHDYVSSCKKLYNKIMDLVPELLLPNEIL